MLSCLLSFLLLVSLFVGLMLSGIGFCVLLYSPVLDVSRKEKIIAALCVIVGFIILILPAIL